MNQPPPIPNDEHRFGHDAGGTIPLEPEPSMPPPLGPVPPGGSPPTMPGMIFEPPRSNSAGFVMLLGVASIPLAFLGFCTCGITPMLALPAGIVAWFWGSGELRKVRAGDLPRSLEGQYQAGRICGLIGALIALLMIALVIVQLVIGFASAAANATMTGP